MAVQAWSSELFHDQSDHKLDIDTFTRSPWGEGLEEEEADSDGDQRATVIQKQRAADGVPGGPGEMAGPGGSSWLDAGIKVV